MEEFIYAEDPQETPAYFNAIQRLPINQSQEIHLIKSPVQNVRLKSSFIPQKKEQPILKKLIKKNKISNLVESCCQKLKMNVTNRTPLEFKFQIPQEKTYLQIIFGQKKGHEMTTGQKIIFSIMNILTCVILSIYFSITLVFPETEENSVFKIFQLFAVILYLTEIVINLTVKKYIAGRKIMYMKQISSYYIKGNFLIDLITILVLIINFLTPASSYGLEFKILRLIILIKFIEVYEKLEQIENIYITTTLREQYWGLVTVFIINFSFAHILAISLNAMAFLETNNWLVKANLTHAMWYEKYIWGYYWGTTTMLTVGYGDFSATNYKEAICLIFIEMISCITLSYNINYVGNLVNNIRQQSIDKDKSLKIFQQMSSKNKISNELESRVKNYIDKSYQIRKEFNFAEEDKVLDSLPENIKRDYLKETNIKMFKQMTFLKDLTSRTQSLLASKLKRQIMHPEQIIHRKQEEQKLLILNQGEIGFRTKNSTGSKNDAVVETIVVNEKSPQPKLISLGFIASIKLSYEIRSLSYSVLFYIEKQDLIEVLKNYNRDYERYCEFRDDSEISPNEIELYQCEFCKNEYHSKFNCSRLHYIPIKQQVVFKYLHKMKVDKQNRICVNRKPKQKNSFLKTSYHLANDVYRFRNESFNDLNTQIKPLDQFKTLNQSQIISVLQQKNNKALLVRSTTMAKNIPGANVCTEKSQKSDEPKVYKDLADLISKLNNKQQNFWLIETDKVQNWKYYFPRFNSKSFALHLRKHKMRKSN